MTAPLKAPFPYFGGKSKVASLIWERFGVVQNYVEPFFGSGAVLLAKPDFPCVETVNDVDGFVANFWRAISKDSEAVAGWADYPVIENDLEARHAWLVARRDRLKWSLEDPDFYDAKIAGWWVWGLSAWIGAGWCFGDGPHKHNGATFEGNAGRGINRQLPHLGDAGPPPSRAHYWLGTLKSRMKYVRVACGDWSRVCGDSVTFKGGLSAIFLDPPYAGEDMAKVYGYDSADLAKEVAGWAIEKGNNPMMRICIAGYAGGDQFPAGWTAVGWKTAGGYANLGKGRGRENAAREMLWFSPHCLAGKQARLF